MRQPTSPCMFDVRRSQPAERARADTAAPVMQFELYFHLTSSEQPLRANASMNVIFTNKSMNIMPPDRQYHRLHRIEKFLEGVE